VPTLRGSRSELRHAVALRALPPRVARFQWRARRLARGEGDQFSLTSATRPPDLAILLELAAGRTRVVELGTATAWTTVSLALADPRREVITFDPVEHAIRALYLELVDAGIGERIKFVAAPGAAGPRDPAPIDLLYIDSTHEREETIAEWRAWLPALRPGTVVVFDDYTHPDFPGVREAVAELGLRGRRRGTMFVHEVGGAERR
jgi:predicted O-methyltransferase YrrM